MSRVTRVPRTDERAHARGTKDARQGAALHAPRLGAPSLCLSIGSQTVGKVLGGTVSASARELVMVEKLRSYARIYPLSEAPFVTTELFACSDTFFPLKKGQKNKK